MNVKTIPRLRRRAEGSDILTIVTDTRQQKRRFSGGKRGASEMGN